MQPQESEPEATPPTQPGKDGEAMVTSKPMRSRPGGGWKRGRLQSRRARLALALGAGVMALLCLGGVGVFIALYDEATEVKRTAPDAVVDNFLGAYLVNRNDSEAKLYQCEEGGDFAEIDAFRSQIQSREREKSAVISVSWSSFTVTVSGGRGTVTTDLTRSARNGQESKTAPWSFVVVDQNGWRVCGATQLP
ncbi:hypothetical protein [Actinoplanes sp. GCM10030250]|uniref:hypothetical protein n=1 Tax=Actinoplanes sp. GCM10030250 TaxID=3273376 RepID=UPI0036203FA6